MSDNNALHDAVYLGTVAEVQAQIGKFDINAKGKFGRTALCWAANEGKTEVNKLLLTHNADVNMPDVRYHFFLSSFPLFILPILPSLRFFYVSLLLGYPSTHS